MLKLQDISFGAVAKDKITGVSGKVTAKVQRMSGVNSVCLEGIDTTGRAYEAWTDLDRLDIS